MTITPERLAAVGDLWRKSRSVVTVAFDGTSMLPTVRPREEVTLHCGVPASTGDVVLIGTDTLPMVHRIVAADDHGMWVLTRGDANLLPDAPVARVQIVGRVTGIHRDGVPMAVSPFAGSALQQAVTRACALLLSISPPLANRAIRALITLRRRLRVWVAQLRG